MKRSFLKHFSWCVGSLLLVGGVMSCSSDSPDVSGKDDNKDENRVEETVKPTEFRSINLTREMRNCNDLLNTASIKLFQQTLAEADAKENLLLSPLSINYVLTTLANGASGDTQKEILDYLGVSDLEETNNLFRLYASELSTLDNQVSISLGNSLWIDQVYTLHPQFKEVLSNGWPVEVISTTLGTEQSRLDINAWVAKNTNNLIPEFLKDKIEGPLGIFNTVYFKGKWSNPFNVSSTSKEMFNNVQMVDMMHGERMDYLYGKGDNWQGVALPYGNGNYQMRLILPNEGVNIVDVKEFDNVSKWGEHADVKVSLPKFECHYRHDDYQSILSAIGIKSLLDNTKCDLSNLLISASGSKALSIDRFLHEAVIKVDEAGAEMAAASGNGDVIWGGETEISKIDLTFDRPFIFEVRESSTNTLIFIGTIRNL